jgi:hypothetical protein
MERAQAMHDRRLRLYNEYDWGSFAISPENRLTVRVLMKNLKIGFFTALQTLTDIHNQATHLVILPAALGAGVKLDAPLDAAQVLELVSYCNGQSQFREVGRGCFNVVEGGHLLCECRQWILQGMSAVRVASWMQQLSDEPLTHEFVMATEGGAAWSDMVADLLELSLC